MPCSGQPPCEGGPRLLPASAVIATRDRAAVLRRTLDSLADQEEQPTEVIIVDAGASPAAVSLALPPLLVPRVVHVRADQPGAAAQRNQGVLLATQPFILFMDDDILLEHGCLARLHEALQGDDALAAASSTITNQQYTPPGRVSRVLFRWLDGRRQASYAGRVIGPGMNLLPIDDPALPDVVPVEWVNTTCTLYRRAALPCPPFPAHFTGASISEDLTLSLILAKSGWRLANARQARIYHDSQGGAHKRSAVALARMELFNRHWLMTRLLGRRRLVDYARLALFEAYYKVLAPHRSPRAWPRLAATLAGKALGAWDIVSRGRLAAQWAAAPPPPGGL